MQLVLQAVVKMYTVCYIVLNRRMSDLECVKKREG